MRGWATKAMLDKCLSKTKNSDGVLICVCGPAPFTESVVRYVVLDCTLLLFEAR